MRKRIIRYRFEDNIKVYTTQRVWKGMDWIHQGTVSCKYSSDCINSGELVAWLNNSSPPRGTLKSSEQLT
jgi:hypothetical protein